MHIFLTTAWCCGILFLNIGQWERGKGHRRVAQSQLNYPVLFGTYILHFSVYQKVASLLHLTYFNPNGLRDQKANCFECVTLRGRPVTLKVIPINYHDGMISFKSYLSLMHFLGW